MACELDTWTCETISYDTTEVMDFERELYMWNALNSLLGNSVVVRVVDGMSWNF